MKDWLSFKVKVNLYLENSYSSNNVKLWLLRPMIPRMCASLEIPGQIANEVELLKIDHQLMFYTSY